VEGLEVLLVAAAPLAGAAAGMLVDHCPAPDEDEKYAAGLRIPVQDFGSDRCGPSGQSGLGVAWRDRIPFVPAISAALWTVYLTPELVQP
jgi:hypothetical protein